jgi:hypothetical protein
LVGNLLGELLLEKERRWEDVISSDIEIRRFMGMA